MPALKLVIESRPLLVAGIMSGTSADGVDAALIQVEGSGNTLSYNLLSFLSLPYPEDLREILLQQAEEHSSDVKHLSQLNFRLAYHFGDAIRKLMVDAGHSLDELDLIGSHGHTVHHVPVPSQMAGKETISTLQIGDPSVLANAVGIPVVGDYRVADMAVGGQGAPLVPYLEFVTLIDPYETRGSLNLGGIANLTVLPAGGAITDVIAFDTGPANIVIDALCKKLFGIRFDKGGEIAKTGSVSSVLLENMLDHPYFADEPPKSTGREAFGEAYVQHFLETAQNLNLGLQAPDLVATATALTARSILLAHERFVAPHYQLARLIASGGGIHNMALMTMLQEYMDPVIVEPASQYGLDPDAKEAICFAIMAHETLHGVPTNLPSVTGASKPVVMGKICLPAA